MKGINLIKVPRGNVTKLAEALGVTPGRVSQALSGDARGLGKKIRYIALAQYEGVEMVPVEKETVNSNN